MKCGHWNRDRPDELCAKVHRTNCDFTDDGAGPIRSIMRMIMADQEELQNLSIILPGDQITLLDRQGCGIKCLRVQGTWEHGVRSCPWDEESLFIPLPDKETGDITGYGKHKKIIGDGKSYSMDGLKEWFTWRELEEMFGVEHPACNFGRAVDGWFFSTIHEWRVVGDDSFSHDEYLVAECTLARYLFPPCSSSGKVSGSALVHFLTEMQCDDNTIVYCSPFSEAD